MTKEGNTGIFDCIGLLKLLKLDGGYIIMSVILNTLYV